VPIDSSIVLIARFFGAALVQLGLVLYSFATLVIRELSAAW